MKKIKHFIGIFSVIGFTLAIWGSGTTLYTVKFNQKSPDIFTKPALRSYMGATPSPSIVLRVPSKTSGSLTTNDISENNIYNTIEKELGKAGFVVRDRALFAKVIEGGVSDYNKISNMTNTDLILELVNFEKVVYKTNKYFDSKDKQRVMSNGYFFEYYGIKVEFKITKVKENDMVGSYTFNYAPCVDGCTYKFNIVYKRSPPKPFETMSQDGVEDFFKYCSAQLIAEMKDPKNQISQFSPQTEENKQNVQATPEKQMKETSNDFKIGDGVTWNDSGVTWTGNIISISNVNAKIRTNNTGKNLTKTVNLKELKKKN